MMEARMRTRVRNMMHGLRVHWFRLRGMRLGGEVALGARIEVKYPARIQLGAGCHIASNVFLRANTCDARGIRLGRQVSVHESVLLAANEGYIEIGDRSWLAPFCLVYGNGGVSIGNDVLIAPRVSINTVSHHAERTDVPINDQGTYCDPVRIDDDVWIGMHAVILQGVHIGRGAIIGAGAVVTRDVPPGALAVGVPARVKGYRAGFEPEAKA